MLDSLHFLKIFNFDVSSKFLLGASLVKYSLDSQLILIKPDLPAVQCALALGLDIRFLDPLEHLLNLLNLAQIPLGLEARNGVVIHQLLFLSDLVADPLPHIPIVIVVLVTFLHDSLF